MDLPNLGDYIITRDLTEYRVLGIYLLQITVHKRTHEEILRGKIGEITRVPNYIVSRYGTINKGYISYIDFLSTCLNTRTIEVKNNGNWNKPNS